MIQFSEVCAFTDTPGTGNPAGVVLEAAGLSEAQMQAVARHLDLPETVFVMARDGDLVEVRYFTPTQEIEFCGHATIALGLSLAQQGWWTNGPLTLDTQVGFITLEMQDEAGVPSRVWMTQRPPERREVARSFRPRLASALGIDERLIHRGLPLASASTGLWSVFVPLLDRSILDHLDPDLDALERLSAELRVSGVHPYAPMGPTAFAARDFAPLVGIPEDPVTGSASGALIALLAASGALPRHGDLALGECYQGHAMGRPGEAQVEVRFAQDRVVAVRVGGCAVLEREGRYG